MGRSRKPGDAAKLIGPDPHDVHEIVFAKRVDGTVPGQTFLNSCPETVRDRFRAIAIAVAAAPPYRHSGGGYWEAMHGDMKGFHEVRIDGPKRTHYRFFCLVDSRAKGAKKPYLVIVDGRSKAFRTTISKSDYRAVRAIGKECLLCNPRRLA